MNDRATWSSSASSDISCEGTVPQTAKHDEPGPSHLLDTVTSFWDLKGSLERSWKVALYLSQNTRLGALRVGHKRLLVDRSIRCLEQANGWLQVVLEMPPNHIALRLTKMERNLFVDHFNVSELEGTHHRSSHGLSSGLSSGIFLS